MNEFTAQGAFAPSRVAATSPKLVLIVTFTGPFATGLAGGLATLRAAGWPLGRYLQGPVAAFAAGFDVAFGVALLPQPVATRARQARRTARVRMRDVTSQEP